MKLKTTYIIVSASAILMIILLIAGSYTKNRALLLTGIVVAFVGQILWMIFGRCESCGGYLGRLGPKEGKHCPHCGERLDW